jgi:hypothetical protein
MIDYFLLSFDLIQKTFKKSENFISIHIAQK